MPPMDQRARGLTGRWRAVSAVTAGLFLAYLVTISPHLVHHLFDQDHGRPACPHLAQSQNTPAVEASPVILTLPSPTEIITVSLPGILTPSPEVRASTPRAPPSSFLSA